MIDPQLLALLCCPETRQPVKLAEAAILERLNHRAAKGELQNRGGRIVQEKIEAGLVREDCQVFYPIRGDIPVMLVEESIRLPL